MVVVGVDGCRGGWIAVEWRERVVTTHYFATINQLLHAVPDAEAVAIDIPLGLSANGERSADSLARQGLKGRSSTIFNAPPRACLEARDDDYARANELSRRDGAKGLSRQSFGLLAKIREVDDLWSRAPCPMYEVHPELSFARLNGGTPMASKKSWAGVVARRDALLLRGIDLDAFRAPAASRVAPDDVLDAGACAWTASCIVRGDVRRFPDPPDFDVTGREMCIRV